MRSRVEVYENMRSSCGHHNNYIIERSIYEDFNVFGKYFQQFLDEDLFKNYLRVYQYYVSFEPIFDEDIMLQVHDVDVLMKRIKNRNRADENISRDYLCQLQRLYRDFRLPVRE